MKKKEILLILNGMGYRFPELLFTYQKKVLLNNKLMERNKKCWKWPKEKDLFFYKWNNIKKMIHSPKLMKRGFFSIRDL